MPFNLANLNARLHAGLVAAPMDRYHRIVNDLLTDLCHRDGTARRCVARKHPVCQHFRMDETWIFRCQRCEPRAVRRNTVKDDFHFVGHTSPYHCCAAVGNANVHAA